VNKLPQPPWQMVCYTSGTSEWDVLLAMALSYSTCLTAAGQPFVLAAATACTNNPQPE
jgi:hypothetical protein